MISGAPPLVSVVTPVYNGEPYLRECIESIRAQTYPNWDYTIVNNCSEDRTREIAEEYAARDPRIRVHNNARFVRQIANHNIAVRQISPASKYCKIVAADDWLFPECLSRMVELAEANPSVGLVSAYGLQGTAVVWTGLPFSKSCVPGREVCRDKLLGGPYLFGAPTSVLYRADLVRARPEFFNESNLHADTEVCFDLLKAHDFGFVHQVLTFTRTQDDSLSSFSDDIRSTLPANVYYLQKYGAEFLSEAEVEERLAFRMKQYYEFLGKSVFRGRDRAFWTFHKNKLRDLGRPLDYWRLGGVAGKRLLDLILNPKYTVEALWQRGARYLGRSRTDRPAVSR